MCKFIFILNLEAMSIFISYQDLKKLKNEKCVFNTNILIKRFKTVNIKILKRELFNIFPYVKKKMIMAYTY